MKLYTEEQMKEAFTNGYLTAINYDGGCNDHFNDYIKSSTPIELPSDEEIIEGRDYNIPIDAEDMFSERLYFRQGAKWVIDKIKNQQ